MAFDSLAVEWAASCLLMERVAWIKMNVLTSHVKMEGIASMKTLALATGVNALMDSGARTANLCRKARL